MSLNQTVSSQPAYPTSCPEEAPRRKIYINGMLVENVGEVNVNVTAYGGTHITLSINPKDVKITEESIVIEQEKTKKKKFTKKQLRDLLVNNLDNMEAITWIKKLKLNGR